METIKGNMVQDKTMIPAPSISIIIPVYNSERWLGECLESVLAQSLRDFEVVAVNDGSTDTSLSILEEYRGKFEPGRMKIVSKENGGLSSARNAGLKVANGKWIFFLDSDDAVHPEAMQELKESAESNDADIAVQRITFRKKDFLKLAMRKSVKIMEGQEAALSVLYQDGTITLGAWGALYDRELLNRERGFEEGRYYEDLELIPRVYASAAKVAVGRNPLYWYRQHDSSFIHTFSPRRFDSLWAVDSLEKKLAGHSPEMARAVADRKLSANFNAFILASIQPGYEDTARQCWGNIRRLRMGSLMNSRVRIKNKAGILLSLLGRRLFGRLSRLLCQ